MRSTTNGFPEWMIGYLVDKEENYYVFEKDDSQIYENYSKEVRENGVENFDFSKLGVAPKNKKNIEEMMVFEEQEKELILNILNNLKEGKKLTLKDAKVLLLDLYSKIQ